MTHHRNTVHVRTWRHKTKQRLVDYKGGKCEVCGYSRCVQALEFHHRDPAEKDFTVSGSKVHNFEKMKIEIDKCALLCANCHREVHQGLIEV